MRAAYTLHYSSREKSSKTTERANDLYSDQAIDNHPYGRALKLIRHKPNTLNSTETITCNERGVRTFPSEYMLDP